MKRILASANILLVFVLQALASYPEPKGFVSDFAGVIPDDVEQRIEAQLKSFEQQTSVEIAVATLKSLGGLTVEDAAEKLFQQWGVGKKGKDNGVLLLIAPNDRKVKIESGYGMEPTFPDAVCGRILDNYAIPNFKQGRYDLALQQCVDAIIARVTKKEAKEPKTQPLNKQESEDSTIPVLVFLGVIVTFLLIAGIFAIISAIRQAWRRFLARRRLRSELKERIRSGKEQLTQLQGRSALAGKQAQGFVPWARIIAQASLGRVGSSLTRASRCLGEAPNLTKQDLDLAERTMCTFSDECANAEHGLEGVENLPAEIRKYAAEAPQQVSAANIALEALRKEIEGATGRGYRLEHLLRQRGDLAEQAAGLNESLSAQQPDHKSIAESAGRLLKSVSGASAALASIFRLQRSNEQALVTTMQELDRARSGITKHGSLLDQLKAENPPEVWQDFATQFAGVQALCEKGAIAITTATAKNSMQQQDFAGAESTIASAKSCVTKVTGIFQGISGLLQKVAETKKGFRASAQEVSTSVDDAKRKVVHSDVGATARQLAQSADTNYQKAVTQASAGGMVNWLTVSALLALAAKKAEEAVAQAQHDINAAEAHREQERRARAAEEARRQEAARRALYESSHRSTSSNQSFSFGGGHSGGGGASRSW